MGSATAERTYGIGNPLDMMMQSAPNAGVEGKRVWDRGFPTTTEITISPDKEIGIEEAVRNSFSFVQIAGMRAGDSNMVANISTGLSWDRQTPMEEAAKEIVGKIGGENTHLLQVGQYKFIGLIKDLERPQNKIERLVRAPVKAYEKHFPNLARAQAEIQTQRVEELLSEEGNGGKFLDIFDGENNLERAYKEDQKHSFVWGTEKKDDILIATNLENNLQSVVETANDEATKGVLQVMQNFFSGTDTQNRYFILFDFSETASCVNVSSNAQHMGSEVWASDAISFSDSALRIYPNGEMFIGQNKVCASCLKGDEKCECGKSQIKAKEASEAAKE